MPLSRDDIQLALFTWLNGATSLPVDWVRQGGSRANLAGNMADHCTLAVTASPTVSVNPEKQYSFDADTQQTIVKSRINKRLTIQAECYTKAVVGNACADAMLDKAVNNLMLDTVRDSLIAVGLGLAEIQPIINVSDLLGTKFEGRARLDMTFNCIDDVSEFVNWVQEIAGTGTVNPGALTIPFDVTGG